LTKHEVRNQNVSFDLFIDEEHIIEVYCDGVSQALIGLPNAKLLFTNTFSVDSETKIEQRKGVVRLTIPTLALLEMCRNVLSQITENQEQILGASKQQDEKLHHFIESQGDRKNK